MQYKLQLYHFHFLRLKKKDIPTTYKANSMKLNS